jgi:hypothetical protein
VKHTADQALLGIAYRLAYRLPPKVLDDPSRPLESGSIQASWPSHLLTSSQGTHFLCAIGAAGITMDTATIC